MPVINHDEMKALIKQALKEWLDEKYAEFGRWTMMAVMALALAGLAYFIFWANGQLK